MVNWETFHRFIRLSWVLEEVAEEASSVLAKKRDTCIVWKIERTAGKLITLTIISYAVICHLHTSKNPGAIETSSKNIPCSEA